MFLTDPPVDPRVQAAYDADLADDGYVNNMTRAWCWRPDVLEAFVAARSLVTGASSLNEREIAVLVAATVSERSDPYCSLAWGARLAVLTTDAAAAEVLSGRSSAELDERENLLAGWARQVVRDPNSTTQTDVDRLRAAGLTDRQVMEATALVAFRLAFSTVNDALGAEPDRALSVAAPEPVRAAVTYGRPAVTSP